MGPDEQRRKVTEWWAPLDRLQRFVLLKMITGELRVGVSQTLVVRALSQAAGIPVATVAARLMGEWTPTPEWFVSLSSVGVHRRRSVAPLSVLPGVAARRGAVGARRAGGLDARVEMGRHPRAAGEARRAPIHLWSRGEELITHRFPEIAAAATHLPDGTVLDGEVLAFRDERPLLFSALQQRIGRQKQVAQMAQAVPVVFMTYDILEAGRPGHP